MNLSKKSRYGLRALIDLALNAKEEHAALGSIAERNQISAQYLEQVFAALRKNGLVRSIKGSQGGYLLARQPEDITVSEILLVLDGSYLIEPESSDMDPMGISAVIQTNLIDRVNGQMEAFLKGVTLADLAEACLSGQEKDMYYI